MADNRGYYGIIPAEVRYDKELSADAKLLFAEITALTNAEGYCWASNEYFETLYGVSESTIIRRINELEKKQYIKKETTKIGSVVTGRKIFIGSKMTAATSKNDSGTTCKFDTHNNIRNELNNLNTKEKEYKKKFTPPTLQELTDFINEHNLNVDPDRWMNYYQSNGFKVGNRRMLNWKASVRYWASSEKKEKKKFTLDEMDVTEEAKKVDFDAIKKGWKK